MAQNKGPLTRKQKFAAQNKGPLTRKLTRKQKFAAQNKPSLESLVLCGELQFAVF